MPPIKPNDRGKCPFCLTVVMFAQTTHGEDTSYAQSPSEQIQLVLAMCPSCHRVVISLQRTLLNVADHGRISDSLIIWPFSSGRPPAPVEVPNYLRDDYDESALVLSNSPKASAALSRRCMQIVLSEAGFTQKDLSKQIDAALPTLPTYVSRNLDAVRNIGNFAAHQQKSVSSGEIIDVEPGEAEWNLDVLDGLFDFYYVKPEQERKKREKLNEKLVEAGKPPITV